MKTYVSRFLPNGVVQVLAQMTGRPRSWSFPLSGRMLALALAFFLPALAPAEDSSPAPASSPAMDGAPIPDPGNLRAYRKMKGQEFQFEIIGARQGAVWGTDTYTDDSPLSLAGGSCRIRRFEPGQQAIVTVKILPGQGGYASTRQNGVLSRSQGRSQGSYQIIDAKLLSPPPAQTNEEATAPVVTAAAAEKTPVPAPPATESRAPSASAVGSPTETVGQDQATPAVAADKPVVSAPEPDSVAKDEAPAATETAAANSPVPPASSGASEPKAGKGFGFFDLLELLVGIGYLAGVLVLLPLVVLTNIAERKIPREPTASDVPPDSEADETFTADDAAVGELLDHVAEELTPAEEEDGSTYKTIICGRQARRVRE